MELVEAEPDAGLGNGGLGPAGRLFHRFAGHDANPCPRLRPALRVRHVPPGDQGRLPGREPRQLAAPPRPLGGGALRRHRAKSSSTPPFKVQSGVARLVPNHPVTLRGIPYRPPHRRLRRQDHQLAALVGSRSAELLRFGRVQPRRFLRLGTRQGHGRKPDRVSSIRTTPLPPAAGCASARSISWSPARWPTSCAASAQSNNDWHALPDKVAIQLNDTHPSLAVAELMRILLDEARTGLGRGLGSHRANAWPTPTTRCCPKPWRNGRSSLFELVLPRHLEIIYEINRRFLKRCR